jgi:hypothetical protein
VPGRAGRARRAGAHRPSSRRPHVAAGRGDGFEAALHTELDGQGGERELRADDCATLVRSVTLVLALAFGPDVEVDAGSDAPPGSPGPEGSPPDTAPEPPPQPAREVEREATPPPEPQASADDDEASALKLGVLLSGGAELTLLPAASPLLTAGVLLELSPAIVLQLRASALPAVSEPITTSASARFDGLATTALGCGRLAGVLELCGGGRAAALRARAAGLFHDDSAIAPWYALVAAAGVAWPSTGPLRIGLEAALAVSLHRPRFAAHGLGNVHRVPLLAPELSVQLQLWP